MVQILQIAALAALSRPALSSSSSSSRFIGRNDDQLFPCGDAFYSKSRYTCYDGNFLCPVLNGQPTLRCNEDCYLPSMYSCSNNHLVQVHQTQSSAATATGSVSSPSAPPSCASTRLHLSDPPYEDHFLSDCNSAAQVVVTSPLPDSNLTLIGPRLLVAWPAGNSGVVAYFSPKGGENGTLAISLANSTETGNELDPIFDDSGSGNPVVGVTGSIQFNTTATLDLAILGSIRTIRDFTEGPSLLQPKIQDAIKFSDKGHGTVEMTRLWLDNVTTTTFSFTATSGSSPKINNQTIDFEAGTYVFRASFNFPQLEQLDTHEILDPSAQSLVSSNLTQVESISFLSYTNKLVAGGYRFLTYFGRDTLIFLLLTEPILGTGNGSATEAVIGAVLERLNRTDGSACHEETIGDYTTWLNLQNNITSTAPQYDYKMIDTDYYLPVALANYLVTNPVGRARADDFLSRMAGGVNPANAGLTYRDLALINAEKIMNTSAPFAADGGQTKENLIHLKDGQVVGQWRDSEFGIGGGRIPYDVNTALVPAALNAIATLASAGVFSSHPEWNTTAAQYAKVWEDQTLSFFNITIPADQARDLVNNYVSSNSLPFPSHADSINDTMTFHAISLDGNNNQSLVRVMNTDDCFRHFLLNTTSEPQLSAFLSQTADHILTPFPAGLLTDVGLVIANPAYGDNAVYGANWTRADYHGTVVWSWQLSMMAKGLERQIARCVEGEEGLAWCADQELRGKVVRAYNTLWDSIEANSAWLSNEVWSWTFEDGRFVFTPFGELSVTESDVVQLWSLTFLAVKRNVGDGYR